jgi:hypothetical protein
MNFSFRNVHVQNASKSQRMKSSAIAANIAFKAKSKSQIRYEAARMKVEMIVFMNFISSSCQTYHQTIVQRNIKRYYDIVGS